MRLKCGRADWDGEGVAGADFSHSLSQQKLKREYKRNLRVRCCKRPKVP